MWVRHLMLQQCEAQYNFLFLTLTEETLSTSIQSIGMHALRKRLSSKFVLDRAFGLFPIGDVARGEWITFGPRVFCRTAPCPLSKVLTTTSPRGVQRVLTLPLSICLHKSECPFLLSRSCFVILYCNSTP